MNKVVVWVLFDPEANRYFKCFAETYELATTSTPVDAFKFYNDFDANRALKALQGQKDILVMASFNRLVPRMLEIAHKLRCEYT